MSQITEDQIPGELPLDDLDAHVLGAQIDDTISKCSETVKKSFTDKVRDTAALVVSSVYGLFNTPTFLNFREVGKELALQEVEMGVAKLLREIVWKVYEKYLPMKEGNFFYNLRHGDDVRWRMSRTALLVAIFGTLAGLMFRQAILERDKGNESRANKINFVGRACFKAIMVETGHALDIDKMIGSLADTLIGYLPEVQKDIEEGGKLIAEQMAKAPNTSGIKTMPPRGSGK